MLAISYQNDGDFRDQSGDSAGALASFRRKLTIDEELLAADPANVVAHSDFAYSHQRLADILAAQGIHAEALLHYRRAAEEYAQTDEARAVHLGVAKSHAGAARAQASLGNRSGALDAVRRAETITRNVPDDRTNSAQRGTVAEVYEYLAETYGKELGKASVSGYCIKFKALRDIDMDVLEAAIRDGVAATT